MGDMRPSPRRVKLRNMTLVGARRGALAVCLLLLLGVAGCGSSDVANELATRLQYEGYHNLSVKLASNQPAGDVVVVRARGNVALSDEEAIESLQNVIWNSLPRRFDLLDIRVGSVQRQASYQQLSQRFGPRDRALDEHGIGTDTSTVVIAISVGTGMLMLLVASAALTMHRRRRWEEREQAQRLALNPAPTYTTPPAFG